MVLVVAATMVAATLSTVPMNMLATTDEEEGEENSSSSPPALSRERTFEKDGDIKQDQEQQSNQKSSRSNVEQTLGQSASQGFNKEDDDGPAHTMSKTIIKDGEVIKVIERSSAEQSSNSKAKVSKDSTFECFACFGEVEIEDDGN